MRGTVLSAIALAALLLALGGIFRYEALHGGGSSYHVTWSVAPIAGPGEEGITLEGDAARVDLPILAPNVTRVEVRLAWSDDAGAPDAFRLTVRAPWGEERTEEGEEGRLTLVFDGLAPTPEDDRLLSASADEAGARMAREHTTTAAVGTWRAEVALLRAPGDAVGAVELQGDGANAWRLSSTLTSYAPTIRLG